MLMNIITHTPVWVFGLLLALILVGVVQSRSRTVSMGSAMILPGAMLCLSAGSVVSAFGFAPAALFAWATGLTAVVTLTSGLVRADQIRFSQARNELNLPGSWWPLILMMLIFATKYVVGAVTAMNPALADSTAFTLTSCALYGGYSGGFLARTIPLWRLSRKAKSFAAVTV